MPIDNNHVENRIRPWALGRRNWLFIGSQLAGEWAAVVMSLLQSAKLNGHEPWAYLKDVLTRLPHAVEQPDRRTAAPQVAPCWLKPIGLNRRDAEPSPRPD